MTLFLRLKGRDTKMKIRLIIFLLLAVSHRVQSQTRLVVNTTCLELAKPSNQQLHVRLSCRQYDYHCLLDESYTKEFEVCKDWRWIAAGKCAYFNTYGRGNIDERNCIQKTNLTCSHGTIQFSSATNTKNTACYVKKEISTPLPSTTSPTRTQSVGGTRSVTGTSDRGNATSITTTSDRHCQGYVLALSIILGIIVPLVSLAVIFSIFMHLKYVPLYRKESQESSDRIRNEDIVEQQPLLTIEMEDTSKSPTTMRHEHENITEARRSGTSNLNANYPADINASDFLEHFENAPSSPTSIKQMKSEASTDVQRKNLDDDKSLENASSVCIDTDKSDNEDKEESTGVFDDTVESLQRIASPTDEQDRKLCTELYNLLGTEGRKLTQEVMTANITRETGKSVKTLLNSLTDQEKNKLKAMLPEESHRILESKTEHDTSFHVPYGLHRIILGEEKSPKSGWGNPVKETDIGIGDDVERLNRIQTIVQNISCPVTVSVESYVRLLDIMIGALIRLDPGAEFKEDYKLLSYKMESIKNPHLTQTMYKIFTDIAKKIW